MKERLGWAARATFGLDGDFGCRRLALSVFTKVKVTLIGRGCTGLFYLQGSKRFVEGKADMMCSKTDGFPACCRGGVDLS